MKLQQLQLSLLGLIVLLAGCVDRGMSNYSSPSTGAMTSAGKITSFPPVAGVEELASKPFQELLTDTAANPPRLIPELSSASSSADRSSWAAEPHGFPTVSVNPSGQSLPPVPVIPANVSLPVPFPPAPTVLQTVPIPNPARSVDPGSARSPSVSVAASSQSAASPARAASPLPPGSQPIQPQSVAARPNTATVPNRLAESVVVTGVVQVGDAVSAIVQVPNERSSRYVRVGDSLANGRIVVNRIEMTADGDPRVIFVQDGIEIVRTVGNF